MLHVRTVLYCPLSYCSKVYDMKVSYTMLYHVRACKLYACANVNIDVRRCNVDIYTCVCIYMFKYVCMCIYMERDVYLYWYTHIFLHTRSHHLFVCGLQFLSRLGQSLPSGASMTTGARNSSTRDRWNARCREVESLSGKLPPLVNQSGRKTFIDPYS